MSGSSKTTKKKPKPEKVKNSLKSSGKRGKDGKSFQIEEFKSVLIEDDSWQYMLVSVVAENSELNDTLLQQMSDLPANFSVIGPNDLNTHEDESPGARSRKGSKQSKRSNSTRSKKTAKTKDTKVKKNSKQTKQNDDNLEGKNTAETCNLLKKYILKLKNNDYEEKDKKEKYETTKVINDIKSQEDNVSRHKEKSLFQRYIILWGFHDLSLIQECFNFNIQVNAIINIKGKLCLETAVTTPDTETKPKKKQKVLLQRRDSEEYSVFMAKFEENIKDQTFLETNKDLLFLEYRANILDKSDEKKPSFQSNFLNILCEISEAKGKYASYKKYLNVQEIPEIQGTLTLEEVSIYSTIVSMVPLECITIPIIVYGMLEQVCWWDEHILSKIGEIWNMESADKSVSASSITDRKSSEHLEEDLTSESTINTKTSSSSEVTMKNITPLLIEERDEITKKSFHLHLPEIDFQKITVDMLLKSPIYKLWLDYPPVPPSRSKWYDFHLQRFKKCAENCYFHLDNIFIFYLHQSVINVLTSKPDRLSIRKRFEVLEQKESYCNSIVSNKESDQIKVATYIQGIISNILCQVTQRYSTNQSQYPLQDSSTNSIETLKEKVNNISLPSVSSEWYKIKTPEISNNGFLTEERSNYRQSKLNKLKSFLFCSELIDLYEDFNKYLNDDNDFTKMYEFLEPLNLNSMCQSLKNAYENFLSVDYYFFPLTDTILLWFNDSMDKNLTCFRKVKGILETPLGFRDFYRYKIGGKTDFEDVPNDESEASELGSGLSRCKDSESNNSEHISSTSHESHFKDDKFPKLTVSNLGSLRVEHSEIYEHFFSPDGTRVTVKKTNYFSDLMNITVSINKNNTFLCYNFLPEFPSSTVKVSINLHNDIIVSANLSCIQTAIAQEDSVLDGMTTDLENNNGSSSLSCDLCLTLPSGLYIEVVQTQSNIGPFYVRQRYLLKGLTCGQIWEETHRCYLSNGAIIIFYSNDTVHILYSNGTMVKCHSFEWEKVVLENTPANESTLKENDLEEDKPNDTDRTKPDSGKKKRKSKEKNEDNKDTKSQKSIATSKKKKGKKVSSPATIQADLKVEKDISNHDIYMYKTTQHSVVSWDGNYEEFYQNVNIKRNKMHDVRIAFETINQELYLQRSDGMTSLFTPEKLSILFPDGSKITSFTCDGKELSVENDELVLAKDLKQECESLNEMANPSKETYSESPSDSLEETGESPSDSLEETGISNSSLSPNNQDSYLNEDNFVYVEASYLFEHRNYARVQYNYADRNVVITLPGNILVHLNKNGMFTIDSDENEKITLTESNLLFEAQVLKDSPQRSITTLQFNNVTKNPTISCQTVDSFCNVFTVDEKGCSSIVKNKDHNCNFDSTECTPLCPENIERYFVLKRDLSGYEMICGYENHINTNTEVIKTPIVKNNNDLFTLYSQTPVYTNHSEEYLMNYVSEHNLPSVIKRKDLLKLSEMPETIWFHPHLSKVNLESTEENLLKGLITSSHKSKETPTAMSIFKCSKMKSNINLSSWFSKAIKQYMKIGETRIKQYFDHYPEEIRNEKVWAEGDFHKHEVLGSKSYYLVDNLPKVYLDNLLKEKDEISIFSVTESNSSKVPSRLDMAQQTELN